MTANNLESGEQAIYRLSATDMLRALRAGHLSAVRIIDALAEAMPDIDREVQAFAYLDLDSARRAAAAVDAGSTVGLLAGVPFAAKDNIETHDMPTGYGTEIYAGCTPARDASCVAAMRQAGAMLVGKTVSTEFAHRHPGKTRNPWNPGHTPGGSSSGSAAAVAAGMVPLAFGTQTTGSVIRPAAYCGVVGYKPTFGDFNVCGVLPNTPDFDTIGTMTRSVADVALVRRALLDDSIPALSPVDVAGLRIGICRPPGWDDAQEVARTVVMDSARALESAGAKVSDFDYERWFGGLAEANRMVSGYEFARTLAYERGAHYDRLSAVLRYGRMADGLTARHADYVAGRRHIEQLRLVMDEAMSEFDLLLTPPAPGAAPAGLGATGSASFNMPWTTLHTPVVTLPVAATGNGGDGGDGGDGLPVGVQLVARRYHDTQLLDQASAVLDLLGYWRCDGT